MDFVPGKLRINGISEDTKVVQLRRYFQTFGSVNEAVIQIERYSGNFRCYALIGFVDPVVAERVAKERKHVVNGRIVKAKRITPIDYKYRKLMDLTSDGNGGLTKDELLNPATVTANECTSVSSNRVELPGEEESDGSPVRSIVCLKNREDMQRFEATEDCFILDFDPDDTLAISKLSIADNVNEADDDPELSVIAEKGKVACRDYPHSRHLCVKYPFSKTAHESFCKLCYCYICDVIAPCKSWAGKDGHCHAIDDETGTSRRNIMKFASSKA